MDTEEAITITEYRFNLVQKCVKMLWNVVFLGMKL